MVLTSNSYDKRLAFAFLDELRDLFFEELQKEFGTNVGVDYRSKIETLGKPYAFMKFERIMARKIKEYKDPRSQRSLQKLNESLLEVQSVMRKNLEDMVTKGEKLESVSNKSFEMSNMASAYKNKAKQIRWEALLKQYGVMGVIGLILLFVIWMMLC